MFQFLIEFRRRIEASKWYPASFDSAEIVPSNTTIRRGNLSDLHQKLRLVRFHTRIKDAPPDISESSKGIEIRAPVFQAHTTVEVAHSEKKEKWKVGWIQAVTYLTTLSQYGDQGFLKMDIPDLTTGKRTMVNDGSARQFPWYNSKTGLYTFIGPFHKDNDHATIHMQDVPCFGSRWALIPKRLANTNQRDVYLRRRLYAANFYVWLVAWNQNTNKAYILKTVKWNFSYDVEVDPTKPIGQRARLISNPVPRQPEILAEDVPIPKCAITPPTANESQRMVWYPNNREAMDVGKPGRPSKLRTNP